MFFNKKKNEDKKEVKIFKNLKQIMCFVRWGDVPFDPSNKDVEYDVDKMQDQIDDYSVLARDAASAEFTIDKHIAEINDDRQRLHIKLDRDLKELFHEDAMRKLELDNEYELKKAELKLKFDEIDMKVAENRQLRKDMEFDYEQARLKREREDDLEYMKSLVEISNALQNKDSDDVKIAKALGVGTKAFDEKFGDQLQNKIDNELEEAKIDAKLAKYYAYQGPKTCEGPAYNNVFDTIMPW